MSKNKELSKTQQELLLSKLKTRFEKMDRFKELEWSKIHEKIVQNNSTFWALNEMEETGGEPNVFSYDNNTDQYYFCDFSKESPKGRRSICYDRDAQESRKKFKPKNNAMDMAADMGIELITEEQYRKLQELGDFDTKTSSWLKTPEKIRKLGGAIFGDFRYDTVFIYHNGAESYYAARGFRGILKV